MELETSGIAVGAGTELVGAEITAAGVVDGTAVVKVVGGRVLMQPPAQEAMVDVDW